MVNWRIRQEWEEYNLQSSYADNPSMFSIRLNYGGVFTKFPGRKYIKGKMKYIDGIDSDLFSVHDMDEIMELLDCVEPGKSIYYHFKRPTWDLDFGLYALGCDEDINHFRSYVYEHKVIEVYTQFWETKLHTYQMSPNPAKIKIHEIPESLCRKSLLLTWSNSGDCPSEEAPVFENVETMDEPPSTLLETTLEQPLVTLSETVESTPAYIPRIDSPLTKPMIGSTCPNVDGLGDTFEWCEPFGGTPMEQDEPNSEKAGEDSQASKDSHDSDDTEDSEYSQDSDYIVDEDNLLDDPEVDMKNFHLNIDKEVEWVGSFPDDRDEAVEGDEELEVINTEEFVSASSSDEGEASKKRKKIRDLRRAHKNEAAAVKDPFYIHQTFSTAKEVKQQIYLHSIQSRRELDFVKNDKNRIRVVCKGTIPNLGILETDGTNKSNDKVGPSQKKKKVKDGSIHKCPWVLLVSKWKKDINWTVKTYEKQHTCLQTRKIRACNYKFLSEQIVDTVEANPEIPLRALREMLEKKYQLGLSDMKVHRAKTKALESIRGDFAAQYSCLRDYLQEVQSRNPNTTVKLQVQSEPCYASETRVFERVYICLGPLKSGFAAGKRDLLGLDGAFMKGPYHGMILTAVGLDGNNCTYPLAYAVVEAENFNSWTWFLTNLGDDLGLYANSNFTFISDRQKGLLPALEKLFPAAEHRYCLRHLHENMKRKWRGKEFKDCLWKCATCTTIPQFNSAMEELKKLNSEAYDWLNSIPPKHWSRSHFSGRAHCDAVLNNMCESLNSKIVKGRDKPIISCLEFIREYIMRKIVMVQKEIDKANGPLTPTATKTLEKIKERAAQCRAVFCGNGKYQVTSEGTNQYVVNMDQQTCSCNRWELTGIPCKHSIAAIWDMRLNNENVGIPETWVHPTYWLKTWKEMYVFKVEPINGSIVSLLADQKKKRRRSATEDDGVSTKWKSVTCTKCGNVGHNGRTCKGQSQTGNGTGEGAAGNTTGEGAAGSSGGVQNGVGNKGKSPML
uniref:SWIM-type domain-containing protein n=1 Tax=Lactuca sativa TaxID=4236 RepID=A0A9R1VM26_LACSA|nr:hypothetical protein LSAT_V11C400164130 [Lactuca sativa]